MSFELRFDKKKRAFTLSGGQYEYSNTVNDEVIKIVTLDTISLRRRLFFTKEHIEYKYELLLICRQLLKSLAMNTSPLTLNDAMMIYIIYSF